MTTRQIPPWVIFHVPHDSTSIPADLRDQFLLDDNGLASEVLAMTDLYTFELFAKNVPEQQVVRFPISRLAVDVERFENDTEEPMSRIGMGAIYEVTNDLRPLRRSISAIERDHLISRWYRPHHMALTNAVDRALAVFGRALVIDAHSFPSKVLPYEADQNAKRPEICIGVDSFHTPDVMVHSLLNAFESCGFDVALNTPFAGALVPSKHFRSDKRVAAVMIEVRRDLYLDESRGTPNDHFHEISISLKNVLTSALMRPS